MSAVLEQLVCTANSNTVTPEAEIHTESSAVTSQELEALIIAAMPWAAELVAPLTQYRVPNWDGYGAAPVSPDLIEISGIFLALVKALVNPVAPLVSPVRDGGVSIEWENGRKYLEVEFSPTSCRYLFDDNEDRPKKGSFAEESAATDLIAILKQAFVN